MHKGKVLFLLVCAFKKVIENFKIQVDIRKGALRFRVNIDNRYVGFIQRTSSFIVII